LFFALAGKRVVVSGGTPAAAWKVELLSAAGAAVDVFAPDACDTLLEIAGAPPDGAVMIHARAVAAADLIGASLVIGACENDDDAAVLAAHARAAGVPINVIDKPKFCDFSFGAIVNRSPLVIGISTDGAAPVFAQAIRAKFEALLPAGFARWAETARAWRPHVQASGLGFPARRRFWQKFARVAVAQPDRVPVLADRAAWLADADRAGDGGTLVILAVVSDDPEMLTLRAVRELQTADAIVVDPDVPAAVLDFARREARKLMLGADGGTDRDTDTAMIGLAKHGKRVVRLVGGAPMSSAIARAIAAGRRHGIPVVQLGHAAPRNDSDDDESTLAPTHRNSGSA
jgi:uroporphyrin-III C-methyltransferase / precorrin-2 dehydrogenase / sirohydrochlorin ferrochelatase